MTQFGLLFSFILTLATASAQSSYTLADLEVLTQEGNYEEFFNHALDIRPSERQDAWKGMVSKMSDGYGRQILGKSEITQAQFQKIENLHTWPVLKVDDVFRSHRQLIGLKYLKQCLKASEPCWNELKAFWEADQKNAEIAFKLAELTLSFPEKPIPTWTFLDVAVKNPVSEFYCKREFVLEAIWGKFEIDYIRLGSQGNLLKKIDETVHPDCLYSFNKWTQQKLIKPGKTSDRELAYQLLAAQDKTNQAVSDFFYTVYLLENPSKGELFNYAWNRLSELSKSVDRREEVLKRIKGLDPLPDELFASLDNAKKRAVLNHFKTKFPEYLYFYADQCLVYYGGKTAFPNGNPTMKCQNLMDSSEASALIGSEKVQKFQQLRSI
jgi:hypothetical protein